MTHPASARPLALRHLEHFLSGALPTVLRQLNCWKGLSTRHHRDLIDDLIQEVVLDCLENAELIASTGLRERHNRWFRLVEQAHYRLRLRSQRRVAPDTLRWVVDPSSDTTGDLEELTKLAPTHRDTLLQLSVAARYLRNGRLNMEGTSRHLQMRAQDLRRLWTSVAEQLGYGDDFLRFWRRRLVEALVGLAADLLRDSGRLRIHDEQARARPDPMGRLRRLRRIRQRVSVRPLPSDMKHALTRFAGPGAGASPSVHEILDMAAAIEPENATVHLWRFEALATDGQLLPAANALRQARSANADNVRVVLARARLLEARGREEQARRLLERAAGRRRDLRLHAALRGLAGS